MDIAMYIVWSKKYELGIPILDEQNRGLTSIINTFFFQSRFARKDQINYAIVTTAEMFKAFVKIYFATIEQLMEMTEFPNTEKFKRKHELMIRKIELTDKKLRNSLDTPAFLAFIKEYWFELLEKHSKEYVDHFKTKIKKNAAAQEVNANCECPK